MTKVNKIRTVLNTKKEVMSMSKMIIACGPGGCKMYETPEGYTLQEAIRFGILHEIKNPQPKRKRVKQYWQNREDGQSGTKKGAPKHG